MPGALFDVERWPARARVGVAAGAEHMHADGEAVALGRFVDRPVAALARRFGTARQHEHLGVGWIVGAPLDFPCRGFAVLVGHDDASLQAWFGPGEKIALPVVDRRREGRPEV